MDLFLKLMMLVAGSSASGSGWEGSRVGAGRRPRAARLLVEGLGVGGGGRDVGVAGRLVRAGGELELVGRLQVGVAGGAVGGGVVLRSKRRANSGSRPVNFNFRLSPA